MPLPIRPATLRRHRDPTKSFCFTVPFDICVTPCHRVRIASLSLFLSSLFLVFPVFLCYLSYPFHHIAYHFPERRARLLDPDAPLCAAPPFPFRLLVPLTVLSMLRTDSAQSLDRYRPSIRRSLFFSPHPLYPRLLPPYEGRFLRTFVRLLLALLDFLNYRVFPRH